MVEYAVARGVKVSVNTNLTLLTPAKAERTATCGLSAIFVSIDGATAETYEWVRVDARFDMVERNMLRLLEALARHGSPTHVEVTAVVMRENVDELAISSR